MSMSGEVFLDNELDQLYKNVALGEPDSNDNECSSQIQLFAAVESTTAEPLGGARLVLTKGSIGEKPPEGGPCQGPPPHLYLNVKSSNARLYFQTSHLLSPLSLHFIRSQRILHLA